MPRFLDNHPSMLSILDDLSGIYIYHNEKFEEGELLLRKALEIKQKQFGEDSLAG